jgi:hypothetical protein
VVGGNDHGDSSTPQGSRPVSLSPEGGTASRGKNGTCAPRKKRDLRPAEKTGLAPGRKDQGNFHLKVNRPGSCGVGRDEPILSSIFQRINALIPLWLAWLGAAESGQRHCLGSVCPRAGDRPLALYTPRVWSRIAGFATFTAALRCI